MSANPIPAGYNTVVVQLAVSPADKAIEFYKAAFGAEVVDHALDPSGTKIWHASLRVGTSMVFVNDVFPEMGDPEPSKSTMWLYVADCDAVFKQAVAAGATVNMPVMDMFWGDRMGQVSDAFGQKWTIATRLKDMTPEEIREAEKAFLAAMAQRKG